ncbi:ParB/RepB/Spo0J family partition protein [Streptomyces calvus]|uniref:ParB family chromosome partitioning protein n=1 Tax=Streptomyces calvus TaxID=67282 RepID=A0AA40SL09_9ACTN|nr:ParB/RepB/Spo0J family partition protein [Streptomyces calvus]MBA8948151.1 ParB family chromosome partitioning protein [Streptomyces calvus]GGP84263.1 plasmid partitioning protein [Streptomyces calvus]
MSKADQLGSGRFGGGVRTVSARRQAVAAATGVPTEGIAPPTELPVNRISLNPDNPRSSLGDLTDLAGSLKTHGQKQAITVMNRDAYVKANPEREADLEPDTTHVVVDGSSRLAAAREAGLDKLAVMVSDNQGSTPEELLESALVANIHRQALEELDEARALQRLLEIHGSQRALAKRLHRSQGWVSQRLALLNLTPELQARIGQEPIDLLRAVGNKPVEQQEAALEELKAERTAKEAARTPSRRATRRTSTADETTTDSPAGDYDVITGSVEENSKSEGDESTREAATGSSAAAEHFPEPRADSSPNHRDASPEQQARRVPFDKPGELALLLDVRVKDNDAFFTLLELLNSKALDRDPARASELARSFTEEAATRIG